jgi:hypothetical protein
VTSRRGLQRRNDELQRRIDRTVEYGHELLAVVHPASTVGVVATAMVASLSTPSTYRK